MLKIFPNKITKSKTYISDSISNPYKEQLLQARGVVDNYLKDKKCSVTIKNCPLSGSDYLEISSLNDSKTSLSRISVLKSGERSFLRKIYEAVEIVVKDVTNKS